MSLSSHPPLCVREREGISVCVGAYALIVVRNRTAFGVKKSSKSTNFPFLDFISKTYVFAPIFQDIFLRERCLCFSSPKFEGRYCISREINVKGQVVVRPGKDRSVLESGTVMRKGKWPP